jgi:hypothetical protein
VPGGISDPVAGYATFAIVKFVGYCAAAFALGRAYPRPTANAALAGLTRTIIGLVVGVAYGTVVGLLLVEYVGAAALAVFLVGLIPVRLAEWWLLIWLYYDRQLANARKGWWFSGAGTAWSFVLDVPALVGAIATAGMWIC